MHIGIYEYVCTYIGRTIATVVFIALSLSFWAVLRYNCHLIQHLNKLTN